jgi:hypothetical protein
MFKKKMLNLQGSFDAKKNAPCHSNRYAHKILLDHCCFGNYISFSASSFFLPSEWFCSARVCWEKGVRVKSQIYLWSSQVRAMEMELTTEVHAIMLFCSAPPKRSLGTAHKKLLAKAYTPNNNLLIQPGPAPMEIRLYKWHPYRVQLQSLLQDSLAIRSNS